MVSDLWPIIFPTLFDDTCEEERKEKRQQRKEGGQAQRLVERTSLAGFCGWCHLGIS